MSLFRQSSIVSLMEGMLPRFLLSRMHRVFPWQQSVIITLLALFLTDGTLTVMAQSLQSDPSVTATGSPAPSNYYNGNPQTQHASSNTNDKNPYLVDFPEANLPEQPPIELKIVETRYLPAAMYGQWSVTATLIDTNLPGGMAPVVHDIWNLFSTDSQVFITNPTTGAEASINVDRVVGNTATFHHQVVLKPGKRILIEQPTVTVDGDTLTGSTRHTFLGLKDGRVEQQYFALFKINAEKLGDNNARFKAQNNPGNLEFEIEDVQVQRVPTVNDQTTVNSSLYQR